MTSCEPYDSVPQAALDVFARSALAPQKREKMLDMFRLYFNEPFHEDCRRDEFWSAIIDERFDDAIKLMLPVHVSFLLEMLRPRSS